MDKKETIFENINEVQEEVRSYIHNSIELTKLHVAQEVSKILSGVVIKTVLFYILFFVLMFTSIAGAFALGAYIDSNVYGFLIIGGVYLLLAIVVLFFKRVIFEAPIIKTIVNLFFPNFEKYDKQQ